MGFVSCGCSLLLRGGLLPRLRVKGIEGDKLSLSYPIVSCTYKKKKKKTDVQATVVSLTAL